jgi:LacI family transcriptional regulator
MVTIKEIARTAGVSISTVSSVINNPDGGCKASFSTRERILRIASELDYQPSKYARGLRAGRSYLLAYIGSGLFTSMSAAALVGAEQHAHRHGYSLVMTSYSDFADCSRRIRQLMRNRIDGMIFSDYMSPEYAELFMGVSQRIPVVNLFHHSPLDDVRSVFVDGAAIGVCAAEYLFRLGHRKILILGPRPQCCEAFKARFNALCGRSGTIFHFPESMTFSDGEQAWDRIRQEGLDVSAVYAYDDHNAAGVINAALRDGRKLPEELSVLGTDNYQFCQMMYPKLSTIAQPQEEQGAKAVELLLKIIRKSEPVKDAILQPSLIERDSCCSV